KNDVDYGMLVKYYGSSTKEEQRALLTGHLSRPGQAADDRQPGHGAYLHELRGAAEPDHADEHAALHAPDQRLLQEDREPDRSRQPSLRLLQLLPRPQDARHDARRGSRYHRPRLETP